MAIKLPRGTDYLNRKLSWRKSKLKIKNVPVYFAMKKYIFEHIIESPQDGIREASIVVAFLLGCSPKEICEIFGLSKEEFMNNFLHKCLRAKLTLFVEAFVALLVSALVERDKDCLKMLFDYTLNSVSDWRTTGLSQLLALSRIEELNEVNKVKNKVFQGEDVIGEVFFRYQQILRDYLEKEGLSYSDDVLEGILADMEAKLFKDQRLTSKLENIFEFSDEKKI